MERVRVCSRCDLGQNAGIYGFLFDGTLRFCPKVRCLKQVHVKKGGVADTKVRLYFVPQDLLMNTVDMLKAILQSISFLEIKKQTSLSFK